MEGEVEDQVVSDVGGEVVGEVEGEVVGETDGDRHCVVPRVEGLWTGSVTSRLRPRSGT